jgi:hypothetical protein
MKISITTKSTKRIVTVFVLGAGVLAFGNGKAFAQSHDQRHEKADFKQHQRDERREFGGWGVRDHQRGEKRAFKQQERLERRYGAYGYSPYGAYSYPSVHDNRYPSGQVGYGYSDGYSAGTGSYYHDPYYGNGQHGPTRYDPYHYDDHHDNYHDDYHNDHYGDHH